MIKHHTKKTNWGVRLFAQRKHYKSSQGHSGKPHGNVCFLYLCTDTSYLHEGISCSSISRWKILLCLPLRVGGLDLNISVFGARGTSLCTSSKQRALGQWGAIFPLGNAITLSMVTLESTEFIRIILESAQLRGQIISRLPCKNCFVNKTLELGHFPWIKLLHH